MILATASSQSLGHLRSETYKRYGPYSNNRKKREGREIWNKIFWGSVSVPESSRDEPISSVCTECNSFMMTHDLEIDLPNATTSEHGHLQ